ncbi:MAG: aminotransferase DegT [Lachnospiraceae bacterium]|nr:aminotransferase DegT [Lachnospiraceae bacterium]
MDVSKDPRFRGIKPLEPKVLLSSPTMHGEELIYIKKAYDTNWMSTVGEHIDVLEETARAYTGAAASVALSCGTAALHLAVKLAAFRLYHSATGVSTPFGLGAGGSLLGKRVFCSDMTFAATVNPILYEGGEPVFIDGEEDTWNMDPKALARAFEIYPEVKLVVLAHLYGTPAKVTKIKEICEEHGALLIEDAAESLGAACQGKQTGTLGDYGVISFNGNKIITGSSGGMLLCSRKEEADRARKWSTQSREQAPWYQHEEIGYNYRMSNVVAGIVRGQWEHLEEHIQKKREIYRMYREGLSGLPVEMNPWEEGESEPNFWLSCMTVHPEAMCRTQSSEREAVYERESGKSCPAEILEALSQFQGEGRPIWKPMHMQPVYRNHGFVTREEAEARNNKDTQRAPRIPHLTGGQLRYGLGVTEKRDVGADLFHRGLCLPSDIKMSKEQQERIIEIIRRCFT